MREDLSDVYFARDRADWEAHQVPARHAWTPDPMRQPDPADIADNQEN